MKKSFYVLTVLVLASTFAVQAAAEGTRKRSVEATTTEGGGRVGLGYATFMDSTQAANSFVKGAFSVWVDLSPKLSLQPFLSMQSSDPFNFDFGTILRVTIHGNESQGFHVGGGFDLGSAGAGKTFFLNIFPIAGFHVGVSSNVALSFDGGPMFHITPSPFQFSIASLSGMAGASIHYFF